MKRYVKLFEQMEEKTMSFFEFEKILDFVSEAYLRGQTGDYSVWTNNGWYQLFFDNDDHGSFTMWVAPGVSLDISTETTIIPERNLTFRVKGKGVRNDWAPDGEGSHDLQDTYDEAEFSLRPDPKFFKILFERDKIVDAPSIVKEYFIERFKNRGRDPKVNKPELEQLEDFFYGNIDWIPEETLLTMGTPTDVRRLMRKRGMRGMFEK